MRPYLKNWASGVAQGEGRVQATVLQKKKKKKKSEHANELSCQKGASGIQKPHT
jgi:hypothetical protein